MIETISPEFLALDILRLISYLNLGFAGTLLLVLVLSLVCCAFEFCEDRRARRRRHESRAHSAPAVAVILLCLFVSPHVYAQGESDIPTIEPTFTRILGSDTLEVHGASMSPDGRWVVFRAGGFWIVSAEGGEPMRLTDEENAGDGLVWFPTSDRIAYRSSVIKTLLIDRETGRPVGPPRQVTLEQSSAFFDVSPDGQWIAYTPWQDGQRWIRIVPSTGGAARTLVQADTPAPLWAPDGRYIYYPVAVGSQLGLVRIPVEGGGPDTVVTAGWVRLGHSSLLLSDAGMSSEFVVTTLEGEPRARFHLPGEMRVGGLRGPDSNNQFLAFMSGAGTALHILPVDGGPVRQLTEGQQEDVPIAWTEDDKILFSTQLNGKEVFLLAPAQGGAMRQVSLPEERRTMLNGQETPVFLSSDGSLLFYEVEGDDPEFSVLKVFSVEEETVETIASRYPVGGWGVTGPGGVPRFMGQDFLYVEQRPTGRELWSWTRGSSRLLRAFDVDEQPGTMGIHGDRLVFADNSEAMTFLRITRLGDVDSRELLSVSGHVQSARWSPNGQFVAMVHVDTSGGRESARVALQEISPSGEPVGDLRYVGGPSLSWWNLRWLPDSRGVLAVGWDDHNVWLFPTDPSEPPVCVTQDDPEGVYQFVLSPDGRHIVYPSWVPRGSSVWLVDLGDIPGGSK